MDIQTFIKSLGGATQVGRELGVPMTTVATWGQRNSVPHWRVPALVALALKQGKSIPPTLRVAA